VVVSATGTDQLTVNPSTLTFTPENWDVPQTVTVSVTAEYDGIEVADVTVSIGDDD